MITPEELEHVDWLILVNERRKDVARKAGKSTLGEVYARAEEEVRELKEMLLAPPDKHKELWEKIFGVDKNRKPATL